MILIHACEQLPQCRLGRIAGLAAAKAALPRRLPRPAPCLQLCPVQRWLARSPPPGRQRLVPVASRHGLDQASIRLRPRFAVLRFKIREASASPTRPSWSAHPVRRAPVACGLNVPCACSSSWGLPSIPRCSQPARVPRSAPARAFATSPALPSGLQPRGDRFIPLTRRTCDFCLRRSGVAPRRLLRTRRAARRLIHARYDFRALAILGLRASRPRVPPPRVALTLYAPPQPRPASCSKSRSAYGVPATCHP